VKEDDEEPTDENELASTPASISSQTLQHFNFNRKPPRRGPGGREFDRTFWTDGCGVSILMRTKLFMFVTRVFSVFICPSVFIALYRRLPKGAGQKRKRGQKRKSGAVSLFPYDRQEPQQYHDVVLVDPNLRLPQNPLRKNNRLHNH
jgi:hypothetical protein